MRKLGAVLILGLIIVFTGCGKEPEASASAAAIEAGPFTERAVFTHRSAPTDQLTDLLEIVPLGDGRYETTYTILNYPSAGSRMPQAPVIVTFEARRAELGYDVFRNAGIQLCQPFRLEGNLLYWGGAGERTEDCWGALNLERPWQRLF